MTTVAYRFPDEATYLEARGEIAGDDQKPAEFTLGGIAVSVIGDHFRQEDPEAEPVYVGYLVNTTAPVEGWDAYLVHPTQFMRVFG